MEESDTNLIRACRQGDSRAWDRLLNKYERLVFSIPLNYGLTREDAADVMQITFIILMQSLDALLEDTRLGPWLATVARRHTWRLLARNRREAVIIDQDLNEKFPFLIDEAGSQAMERWELIEWLHYALFQLDDNCRNLLLTLYFGPQQLSYSEVADTLKMPVGSIGPTRARCLERLRQLLLQS